MKCLPVGLRAACDTGLCTPGGRGARLTSPAPAKGRRADGPRTQLESVDGVHSKLKSYALLVRSAHNNQPDCVLPVWSLEASSNRKKVAQLYEERTGPYVPAPQSLAFTDALLASASVLRRNEFGAEGRHQPTGSCLLRAVRRGLCLAGNLFLGAVAGTQHLPMIRTRPRRSAPVLLDLSFTITVRFTRAIYNRQPWLHCGS
jgi:hypothetical protein